MPGNKVLNYSFKLLAHFHTLSLILAGWCPQVSFFLCSFQQDTSSNQTDTDTLSLLKVLCLVQVRELPG